MVAEVMATNFLVIINEILEHTFRSSVFENFKSFLVFSNGFDLQYKCNSKVNPYFVSIMLVEPNLLSFCLTIWSRFLVKNSQTSKVMTLFIPNLFPMIIFPVTGKLRLKNLYCASIYRTSNGHQVAINIHLSITFLKSSQKYSPVFIAAIKVCLNI